MRHTLFGTYRYVRVTVTGSSSSSRARIIEAEVFGTSLGVAAPSGSPSAPPPTAAAAPTPTPTAIHNLVFGSNQTYTNVTIGGPGEQVRHIAGAHDTTFIGCTFIGGSTSPAKDIMTLGGPCGSLTNVRFVNCTFQCNLGTENATRSLGLNNIGISDDASAHVQNLSFEGCVFGAFNGTRSGSPRMNVEVLNRGGNVQGLHFVDCTFEASDETCLDIETSPYAPTTTDILIQGCIIKGGTNVTNPLYQQSICLELAPGTRILNNTIGDSRWGAIEVYDRSKAAHSGAIISGNTISGQVYLTGAHGVTVTGNSFDRANAITQQDGASGNTTQ
jgi:hypothetical protein